MAGTEPAIRVDAGLLHVPYPEVPAAFQAEPGTLRMVSPGPVELTFVGAGAGEVLIDGRSVEAGIPVQVVDGAAIAIPRAVGVHIRPPGSGPLPPDGPG